MISFEDVFPGNQCRRSSSTAGVERTPGQSVRFGACPVHGAARRGQRPLHVPTSVVHHRIVGVGNRLVRAVLESPAHRLLSGSTDVIRYQGRRSGKTFSTPTQYAQSGDDVVILVGRPESKSWWKNFREDRDLEVLVRGRWLPMVGRAVLGSDDPEATTPLLDAYLARFPKASRHFRGDAGQSAGSDAVVVWCRPR